MIEPTAFEIVTLGCLKGVEQELKRTGHPRLAELRVGHGNRQELEHVLRRVDSQGEVWRAGGPFEELSRKTQGRPAT
jgi:hypothetical protein